MNGSTGTSAVEVVVRGDVQGVFFRDTCRQEAEQRGLSGWVRNEPDGTVTAHFEGPADGVAALVTWCRHGPRHADVEDVEQHDVKPTGQHGFSVG